MNIHKTFLLLVSILWLGLSLISCDYPSGGDDGPTYLPEILAGQTLWDEELTNGDYRDYHVILNPVRLYAVELNGLSGDLNLLVDDQPTFISPLQQSAFPGTARERCSYLTGLNDLYIRVDNYENATVSFSLSVTELTNLTYPNFDFSANSYNFYRLVPDQEYTQRNISHITLRDTYVIALNNAFPHEIILVNQTPGADLDLYLYSDSTLSTRLYSSDTSGNVNETLYILPGSATPLYMEVRNYAETDTDYHILVKEGSNGMP